MTSLLLFGIMKNGALKKKRSTLKRKNSSLEEQIFSFSIDL